MTIKAVIFDIGNVLITWDPERLYDAVIGEDRRKKMFSEVDLHGMNEQVDLGGPFKKTIYDTADQYPDWGNEIRMWYDRWIEMASPTLDQSIACLRALRAKGIPVFALSNFGIESFDYAVTKYPVLDEFDRRYISGHLRLVKPNPAIYDIVEKDCGISPNNLLFADDRLDNCEAAAARGWHVHQFKTQAGWAAELVDRELLSVEEAGL